MNDSQTRQRGKAVGIATAGGAPPAVSPHDEEALSAIKSEILSRLMLGAAKDASVATQRDWFVAAASVARDRIIRSWLASERADVAAGRKRVYYLSLEFLIGRLYTDVLSNLGLKKAFDAALGDLGVDLNRMRDTEPDAALGNGGLGRLAACFMESMATLGIPGGGYGIRYDHGLFRQVIKDGWQQEYPETWLSFANPWEFGRAEVVYDVHFGGHVEMVASHGGEHAVWHPGETVEAAAFDLPIIGFHGRHANPLRLWSARAVDPLRLDAFNSGDHVGALNEQMRAEAISKVLYPSDATAAGRELRLRQEYFFVSASLQDIVRRHIETFGDLRALPDQVAIQLNDTHPSIAVPELMRILVDIHGMAWDDAWPLVNATLSYTNHTLLPEALESWPVPLFERLLPRHQQIVYRINADHLSVAKQKFPGDDAMMASVSLIDENDGRHVRMGHLAFVGSHRVNGVSALHTDLMRKTVFRDLHALYPDRIVNKTNGITFRRWLYQANPVLTRLLRDVCGREMLDDPSRLAHLRAQSGDAALQDRVTAIKRANKVALSNMIAEHAGVRVDPDALFDVQIKRIHEYKRQLLNLLETVALYNAIRLEPDRAWIPRVKIFAGKAAASYTQAKLIIKLANDIAATVNADPRIRGLLKVIFLPNYNVSCAETIIPAADLSEQISTAGMEASGTGNMKLSLNGALTVGTYDGANVEIAEHVGRENIFIFGLTAQEVAARRLAGTHDPREEIENVPMLRHALAQIESGAYSEGDAERFKPLIGSLRNADHYLVTADFAAYYAMQRHIDEVWRKPREWARLALLNIAGMAYFSSDRSIREYADDIWRVPVSSG
ncbi:MAG: glycogen/starch/alpha-glucan phosphorylase [Variibacter sp.]